MNYIDKHAPNDIDDDRSDIIGYVGGDDDDGDDFGPSLKPLMPGFGAARDQFVRETAKALSDMHPGLKIVVPTWGRLLQEALTGYYVDAFKRVVTVREFD